MQERRRLMRVSLPGALAWGAVLVAGLWLCAPLVSDPALVYSRFNGDQIKTQWFYDYASRIVLGQADLWLLEDFGFPEPPARGRQYPALADALLAAPAALLLSWPRQWGVTQAMTIIGNGLGMAALARALGGRALGVVVAGGLGVSLLPIWRDVYMGRMNSAWPGLVAGGLAAALAVTRPPRTDGPRGGALLWRRLVWLVPIGVLGAASGVIYPPYLMMMAPLGAIALLPHLRRSAWPGWAVMAAGSALAVWVAWADLSLMLANPPSLDVLEPGTCPEDNRVFSASRWLLVAYWPPAPAPLTPLIPGVALASWILAPLALLSRRRGLALSGLAMMVLLAVPALGPCPSWASGEPLAWPWLQGLSQQLDAALLQVHDRGRFATAGTVIGAVWSAIGLSALAERGWLLRGAAWALGLGVIGAAGLLILGEQQDPGRWNAPPTSPAAAYLRTVPPAPVAELPFNTLASLVSALQAPGHQQVNPLDGGRPPGGDAVARWLFGLGAGQALPVPVQADFDRSSLKRVVFSPLLCADRRTITPGCETDIEPALRAVLGEPVVEGEVVVWEW